MSEFAATVVVPARGRGDMLARCLDALARQEAPGGKLEVVVCDDGSREDLEPIVSRNGRSEIRFTMKRQGPRGPAAARNLGLKHSLAPVVIFLDSDVIPKPGFVAALCRELDRNPGWQGAEPRLEAVGGEDNPLWDAPYSSGGRYLSAAIAYRREALLAVGGFDEAFTLAACEDIELAARVMKLGPIRYVPEAVAEHPRRPVTLRTIWRWRRFWWFTAIVAARYGFLAWPEKPTRFPRLRTAVAAVVTLPAGRARAALRWLRRSPRIGAVALAHAVFDVACGIIALPEILFRPFPQRRDYLRQPLSESQAADEPARLHHARS